MKHKKSKKKSKSHVAIPTFKIEQSEKADITANTGLFLVAELMRRMEMIDACAQLQIYNRQTIGEAMHILALVINQFAGGDAIVDTSYLKSDGALRKIFGDVHIPAPTTSGDFLERFTQETTEKLRAIIWQMQEKYLRRLAKRYHRKIVISLDSSIYEVYGNCKEQSSQSYKNIFGFHPLLLHIHNTGSVPFHKNNETERGELLDIIFRPGKDFTSTGAAQMLAENIRRVLHVVRPAASLRLSRREKLRDAARETYA